MWKSKTLDQTQCNENPPNDLPLNEECAPCPKVEPADKCPEKRPDNELECSNVGLKCSYKYSYTGCNVDQLKCRPLLVYTCEEDKIWSKRTYEYIGGSGGYLKCITSSAEQILTTSPTISPTYN